MQMDDVLHNFRARKLCCWTIPITPVKAHLDGSVLNRSARIAKNACHGVERGLVTVGAAFPPLKSLGVMDA